MVGRAAASSARFSSRIAWASSSVGRSMKSSQIRSERTSSLAATPSSSTGTHGQSEIEETEPSAVRSPRFRWVRRPAATFTTSPPSIVPTRSLASEQSVSYPIPPTGMTSPPHAWRNSASPPSVDSTTRRVGPGKSGEAAWSRGPTTTVWQPRLQSTAIGRPSRSSTRITPTAGSVSPSGTSPRKIRPSGPISRRLIPIRLSPQPAATRAGWSAARASAADRTVCAARCSQYCSWSACCSGGSGCQSGKAGALWVWLKLTRTFAAGAPTASPIRPAQHVRPRDRQQADVERHDGERRLLVGEHRAWWRSDPRRPTRRSRPVS